MDIAQALKISARSFHTETDRLLEIAACLDSQAAKRASVCNPSPGAPELVDEAMNQRVLRQSRTLVADVLALLGQQK